MSSRRQTRQPLKRAIQEHLLDPPATRLLQGEFAARGNIRARARRNPLISGED
jgi:hypothetical protein